MKTRTLIIAQFVLLAAAVILGALLKGDLPNGPRILHQATGSLGGVLSIITAVVMFRLSASMSQKTVAVLAASASLAAGAAGRSLESTSNYDLSFAIMALSGLVATALTLALFVMRLSRKQSGTPIEQS